MVTDELFTPQEVADRLKVHINSVYNYINAGKLKVIRMEGLLRIRNSDLEKFLENGSNTTAEVS